MDYIAAKCPQCHADLNFPEDKEVFDCEYFGQTIIVKDILAQRKYISNWMKIAKSALDADNKAEAYTYYNKILEVDSTNYEAWYGKAMSTDNVSEMFSYAINAIEHAPDNEADEIRRSLAQYVFKHALESEAASPAKDLPEFRKNIVKMLGIAHKVDPENKEILKVILDKIYLNTAVFTTEEIKEYEEKYKALESGYLSIADRKAQREAENKKIRKRNNIIFVVVIGVIILLFFVCSISRKKNAGLEEKQKKLVALTNSYLSKSTACFI